MLRRQRPSDVRRRFPGYQTREEYRERESVAANHAVREANRTEQWHRKMAHTVLALGLPLLREHAQSSAIPIEIERGRLVKQLHVEAGWLLSQHVRGGEDGWGNYSEAVGGSVLTESGEYGEAWQHGPNFRVDGARLVHITAIDRLPSVTWTVPSQGQPQVAVPVWEGLHQAISGVLDKHGIAFNKPAQPIV